jgi:hypothetical protein
MMTRRWYGWRASWAVSRGTARCSAEPSRCRADTDTSALISCRIREKLFHICGLMPRVTKRHFETFLNARRFDLVLKHGDFGTSNILFDRRQQMICGD